jgi:hypothetical protein
MERVAQNPDQHDLLVAPRLLGWHSQVSGRRRGRRQRPSLLDRRDALDHFHAMTLGT